MRQWLTASLSLLLGSLASEGSLARFINVTRRLRRVASLAVAAYGGAMSGRPPRLKLMFVHVPKTAGTTIRGAILRHFRPDRVFEDYAEGPGNPVSDLSIDPDGYCERYRASGYPFLRGKQAVVGHFWIRKYDRVAAEVRATILRDPVQRCLSHFHYWRATPPTAHPVKRYLLEHELGLLDFARLPLIRRFYCDRYFKDVDMGGFDHVFDQAHLQRDWESIMARLGLNPTPAYQHLNETRSHMAGYVEDTQRFMDAPKNVAALRDLLADDIRFFERYAR